MATQGHKSSYTHLTEAAAEARCNEARIGPFCSSVSQAETECLLWPPVHLVITSNSGTPLPFFFFPLKQYVEMGISSFLHSLLAKRKRLDFISYLYPDTVLNQISCCIRKKGRGENNRAPVSLREGSAHWLPFSLARLAPRVQSMVGTPWPQGDRRSKNEDLSLDAIFAFSSHV